MLRGAALRCAVYGVPHCILEAGGRAVWEGAHLLLPWAHADCVPAALTAPAAWADG